MLRLQLCTKSVQVHLMLVCTIDSVDCLRSSLFPTEVRDVFWNETSNFDPGYCARGHNQPIPLHLVRQFVGSSINYASAPHRDHNQQSLGMMLDL